MITIRRLSSYADFLRTYNILIDGKIAGTIKNGETKVLPAPTVGAHEIWVTIDWCQSNKLAFTYDQTPLTFECASDMRGARVFLAIFKLFTPKSWCTIRQV